MRIVLQRVKKANVSVDEQILGEINQGFVLLVAFENQDQQSDLQNMVKKIINLRIFEDDDQKMNFNIQQIKGEILSVSQFTLYADVRKGNRPNFMHAGDPEIAEMLYAQFNQMLAEHVPVATGEFGADMEVSLVNDGPVTLWLDSARKRSEKS